MSLYCYIFAVFAIIRTVQAKLDSHKDFAMCYAIALGSLVMAGCFVGVTGLVSKVEVCVSANLMHRSCLRFQSKFK
jgi:hypothetical protein